MPRNQDGRATPKLRGHQKVTEDFPEEVTKQSLEEQAKRSEKAHPKLREEAENGLSVLQDDEGRLQVVSPGRLSVYHRGDHRQLFALENITPTPSWTLEQQRASLSGWLAQLRWRWRGEETEPATDTSPTWRETNVNGP